MDSKKIRTAVFIGLASWGVSMITFHSDDAQAKWRRVHGHACVPSNASSSIIFSNLDFASYSALGNPGASTYINCSMPSDSYLEHQNMTYLYVDGWESPDGDNYSRACVVDTASSSASCGLRKDWGSVYTGADLVDTSAWQTYSNWIPFVYNRLKGSGGRLHGMYSAD